MKKTSRLYINIYTFIYVYIYIFIYFNLIDQQPWPDQPGHAAETF